MSLIFINKIDEILYKIKSNDLNSAKKLSLKLIKKNKKDFPLHQIKYFFSDFADWLTEVTNEQVLRLTKRPYSYGL